MDARFMVGDKIRFIDKCPECGSPLTRYEGEAAHYCTNDTACPPQIKGKIEHFVSRKAMNIDGLGSETIDQFYQEGLIHTIADLYALKAPDIARLERMGKKSALNIMEGTVHRKMCRLNGYCLLWASDLWEKLQPRPWQKPSEALTSWHLLRWTT